jgi:lipopolysaccharide/colanic/teichoic acid biosynthesis glycosyltransferase
VIRSLVFDQEHELGLAVKRLADIVGSVLGLVILGPLLLVTAVTILLREGSPVLFSKNRVGVHGRPFTIRKFRTMVPAAKTRYGEVAALSDTKGAAFKMVDDPRVTPLGAFLRRTGLDELPQLWNVLKGDMSRSAHVRLRLARWPSTMSGTRRRLSMKPGITGSGRSDHDLMTTSTRALSSIWPTSTAGRSCATSRPS